MGSFLAKRFWMFKLLKTNTVKSKKKENNCPSELFTNYRGYKETHTEILEYMFWKIQESIHGGAFWFNFSWQKYSTTDGCFWDYLGKPSVWLSVLEMQSLENVEIVALKKNPWWCTFLILANKALHDYSFPVILSNIAEGLF